MQVKEKMKKPLKIVILAAVLAVLTVAAILLNTLLAADSGPDSTEGKKDPPQIIEGESIYANSAIAYPRIEETDIDAIRVYADREYIFKRDTTGSDKADDKKEEYHPFILFYEEKETGEFTPFYPDISYTDTSFKYEDLYAIEADDGYGTIPKLTYLCTAIGTVYFGERIEITSDSSKREEDLHVFGLSEEDKPLRVDVEYYGEGGKIEKHTIRLGDKLITGKGYYFMVDDRNYVYSTNTPYFDYAFLSFTEFINPMLVAKGLPQDSAFEPYLTTDLKQWKNYVISDKGVFVDPDSTVVASVKTYLPTVVIKDTYNSYYDGYEIDPLRSLQFNLAQFKSSPENERLYKVLTSNSIGTFDPAIFVTIPKYSNIIEFGDNETLTYVYTVKSIEAILTDGSDITASGNIVGDSNLIRISYDLMVGDKMVSSETCHGVLDISSGIVPDDVEAKLRASAVGDLDAPLKFSVDYNKENSVSRSVEMVITEITGIESIEYTDTAPTEVAVGTVAAYRYYLIVDGVRVEGDGSDAIRITENMTGDAKLIADALMGRKKSDGLQISIDAYNAYCEAVASFTAYEITEIEYFVKSDLIVSFAFEQASKRDPYYGESLYSNTMEGHKYELYALNAASCESILKILGGLETSATASVGLSGVKTVDIGITADKMKLYGLYSNSIYFELPRGITNIKYDDVPNDEYLSSLDDYTYYATLGFNLYISDVKVRTDGSLFRYIASDMYDVISEVDAEKFFFLDETFISFYARKELVLTDISDIAKIEIDFFMKDVYGSYSNELIHNELYAYGGKVYSKAQLDRLAAEKGDIVYDYATKYDSIEVVVTPNGDCIDTELSKLIASKNENRAEGVDEYTYISLRELYDGKFVELESLGTANFKEFIEMLFYVHYEGFLTSDEQSAGAVDGVKLMKLNVSLYEGYSAYSYAYEFYRISDRRIMVKIYRENMSDGTKIQEVSDFYISTFSFKRIVNAYFGLLNKQTVDNDGTVYPESLT